MTDKDTIIQLLKKNKFPFGLWPDPECYGEELGKEMQAVAKGISRVDFQCYMRHGVWLKCHIEPGEEDTWTDGITYRLRPDYEDEPEIVECEIYRSTAGDLLYNGHGNSGMRISAASCRPDFIGFKFADGTVMGSTVKYSVPGITSHGYYASYEDLKTSQALEHHAISVLFRRKKQE